jgi:hypothetical protein
MELYLTGGLPALGAGVSRLPDQLIAAARERRASVIAELGIAVAWRVPLPRLAAAEHPSTIVTCASTPPLLRDAATALAGRLGRSSTSEVDCGASLPHVGAAGEIASLALALSP